MFLIKENLGQCKQKSVLQRKFVINKSELVVKLLLFVFRLKNINFRFYGFSEHLLLKIMYFDNFGFLAIEIRHMVNKM